MAATPWAKFSLPGSEPAYARGTTPEFFRTLREVFGTLVERVDVFPAGAHPWLMAEVAAQGSLSALLSDLQARITASGSLWVVFPKKPFAESMGFPFSWGDVQKAGLAAGLVDNKVAAFSARLTALRFVVPLARRKHLNP